MRRPCLQFVDDNDKFLEEIKLSIQVRPQLEDDSQVVPFHKREPGKFDSWLHLLSFCKNILAT